MPRLALILLLLALPAPVRADGGTVAVRAAAEAALTARFPGDVHRLEVRVLRTGGGIADAGPFRVRFTAEHGVPRAHTQVDVLTGSDAAGWTEAGWAMLYVAHFDSVALAARDRAPDEVVAPQDLRYSWIETTRFRGTPLDPAAVRRLARQGALFATRPLREGRPVREGDLRPPYAADTGEAVTMRYRRARVTLSLRCTAREPGVAGDVIRVYAADTRTHYRVRLTGPGTAEWTETL